MTIALPKFANGQWYVDLRAVYLEKAISPRAMPLFEAADIAKYKITLFPKNKAPKLSLSDKFSGEETIGTINPR